MEAKEKEKDMMAKMEMLENVIGQLYKIFSRQFDREDDFWMQLSKEEQNHAKLIKELGIELKQGKFFLRAERFKIEAVQTTIRYVQKRINQVHHYRISEQEACHIAWDIENGLLEKNFFITFETDQPALRKTLKKLIYDTREHRNRIRERKQNHHVR